MKKLARIPANKYSDSVTPEFLRLMMRQEMHPKRMSENFFLWYPTLVDPPKSPL